MVNKKQKAEKITDIATKRGFMFRTAEYYGGKAGFWSYGHLGTIMKKKWENLWRNQFLRLNDNYFEIEANNILPAKVFEASGHLKRFNDPLTECKKCHFRFRADQLIEDELNINAEGLSERAMDKLIKDNKLKCPKCGGKELDKVKWFNMMFKVNVGASDEDAAYLSPETAQAAYLAFKRQFLALREKLPMGLAILGKAYRNEISPRQGFFRLREFNQAELQIFFNKADINKLEDWDDIKDKEVKVGLVKNRKKKDPIIKINLNELNKKDKIPKFYLFHLLKVQEFYLNVLKIPEEKFRFRELGDKERAFYNKIHFDIELDLDTLGGFREVAGIHFRDTYDLKQHQKASKEKLEVTIDKQKITPAVLELSFGIDRNIWSLLDIFFKDEKERSLFQFPGNLSPLQVSVFPLINKEGLPEKAKEIYEHLKSEGFRAFYDASGSIGKMYRRADEAGIKAMVTVDHQSLEDGTITLRDRDSMQQIRLSLYDLKDILDMFLKGELLQNLGEVIKKEENA